MKTMASRLLGKVRGLGPYVLVELLLPGGTLTALLLWLSSASGRGHFADVPQATASPAAIEQIIRAQSHSRDAARSGAD